MKAFIILAALVAFFPIPIAPPQPPKCHYVCEPGVKCVLVCTNPNA